MNKQQIARRLGQVGAAWAVRDVKYVSPDDPMFARPTYHIHPDKSYPHVNSIIRFSSLSEIAAYLAARDQADADPQNAFAIMEDFWYSIS